MKKFLLILAVIFLISCEEDPAPSSQCKDGGYIQSMVFDGSNYILKLTDGRVVTLSEADYQRIHTNWIVYHEDYACLTIK